MSLHHRWRFLKGYLSDPDCVGALGPSSPGLAAALCAYYRRSTSAARVLEVGAGTGPVTRHLGTLLRPGDHLDVCEIQPAFADILERDVLSQPDFKDAVEEGRVRLLRQPVQEIVATHQYDFVISGLPLTRFEFQDVQDVFDVIRNCLKPGGVFSYFEYVGIRKATQALSIGRNRKRIRSVSSFLNDKIRTHEFDRRVVLNNFPPACTRYLRFSQPDGSGGGNKNTPENTSS